MLRERIGQLGPDARVAADLSRDLLIGLRDHADQLGPSDIGAFVERVTQYILDWMGTGNRDSLQTLRDELREVLIGTTSTPRPILKLSPADQLAVQLKEIGRIITVFLRSHNAAKYLGYLTGGRQEGYRRVLEWAYEHNRPFTLGEIHDVRLYKAESRSSAQNALDNLVRFGLLQKKRHQNRKVMFDITWDGRVAYHILKKRNLETTDGITYQITPRKKAVALGAGFFDSVFVRYAIRRLDLPYDVDYVPWDKIADQLEQKIMSAGILNRKTVEARVGSHLLHCSANLVLYRGFAIMVHSHKITDKSRFALTQEALINEMGYGDMTDPERLYWIHKVLDQLRGCRVIASISTDHSRNLAECLTMAGLALQKLPDDEAGRDLDENVVFLLGDDDPARGLQNFLEYKADAYVGGLPQRFIATSRGCITLISDDVLKLGLGEMNALVVHRDIDDSELAQLRDDVLKAFYSLVHDVNQELSSNGEAPGPNIGALITSFNDTAILRDQANFSFKDFKNWWGKQQVFFSHEGEAVKEWESIRRARAIIT